MYKRVKKDTKWTIQDLGSFNIDAIKQEVSTYSDEWFLNTSRQEKGTTHMNTFMFRLFETDYEWIPGTPIQTDYINTFKTKLAQNQAQKIFDFLEKYYSGKVIRCEIIKLKANSEVYKHTDGGALLHYSRRVHIPLITHEHVTFTVMDNTIHMKEGIGYEINNQLPHSVLNGSDIDRIHMIVDILPDEMLTYNG
jgi:hypothetical protein